MESPKCPIHDIVLITRFDEKSQPGLAIPLDERYCWRCEKERAPLGATWNGRVAEKCPEPNCDGEKDHGGKHFAWMAD